VRVLAARLAAAPWAQLGRSAFSVVSVRECSVVAVEEPEEPAFGVGDEDGRDVVGVHATGEVVQLFVGSHGGRPGPHGVAGGGVVVAGECRLVEDAEHDALNGGDDAAVLAGCRDPLAGGGMVSSGAHVGVSARANAPARSGVAAVPSVGSPAASQSALPAV
jgi:hypothetical protein